MTRSGTSSISITARSAAIASRISPSRFAPMRWACRPRHLGQGEGAGLSWPPRGSLDSSWLACRLGASRGCRPRAARARRCAQAGRSREPRRAGSPRRPSFGGGAAVQEPVGRCRPGFLQRRDHRGRHYRARPLLEPARHRQIGELPVQGLECLACRDRAPSGCALSARRQHPPRRQSRSRQRRIDRGRDRAPRLVRNLQCRGQGHLRRAGRHRQACRRRGGSEAHPLRAGARSRKTDQQPRGLRIRSARS